MSTKILSKKVVRGRGNLQSILRFLGVEFDIVLTRSFCSFGKEGRDGGEIWDAEFSLLGKGERNDAHIMDSPWTKQARIMIS